MTRSNIDPFVVYRRDVDSLDGVVLLPVDDSLAFGSDKFMKDEGKGSKTSTANHALP